MVYARRYHAPPIPTDPMNRGHLMYSTTNSGQWHPTVLYLVGLIIAEILLVGIIRKFPMPL